MKIKYEDNVLQIKTYKAWEIKTWRILPLK